MSAFLSGYLFVVICGIMGFISGFYFMKICPPLDSANEAEWYSILDTLVLRATKSWLNEQERNEYYL